MGPRVALDETTTALKAISQAERYFRDQNVLVLGGAATGAWVVELAIASGAKNVRWVAPRGFDAANPGGRNSEVMKLTEGSRTKANLETVKFLGDLSHGAGLEAALTEVDTGKQDVWKPDRIIAATGADPLAPTGVISVLGSEYAMNTIALINQSDCSDAFWRRLLRPQSGWRRVCELNGVIRRPSEIR